jgi:hypothetical protein
MVEAGLPQAVRAVGLDPAQQRPARPDADGLDAQLVCRLEQRRIAAGGLGVNAPARGVKKSASISASPCGRSAASRAGSQLSATRLV